MHHASGDAIILMEHVGEDNKMKKKVPIYTFDENDYLVEVNQDGET